MDLSWFDKYRCPPDDDMPIAWQEQLLEALTYELAEWNIRTHAKKEMVSGRSPLGNGRSTRWGLDLEIMRHHNDAPENSLVATVHNCVLKALEHAHVVPDSNDPAHLGVRQWLPKTELLVIDPVTMITERRVWVWVQKATVSINDHSAYPIVNLNLVFRKRELGQMPTRPTKWV